MARILLVAVHALSRSSGRRVNLAVSKGKLHQIMQLQTPVDASTSTSRRAISRSVEITAPHTSQQSAPPVNWRHSNSDKLTTDLEIVDGENK